MDEQQKQDLQENNFTKDVEAMPSEDIQQAGVETLQDFSMYDDDYEAPKLSAVQRMIKIFTSPTEVFEDILRKKKVYPPIILVLFVGVVVALLQKDIYVEFLKTAPDVSKSMTPEELKGFLNAMALLFIVMLPTALLASMTVKAAATKLISTFFSSEGTFSQTFAVLAYAYVIQMLGVILRCAATLATGNFNMTFSPAILMSQDKAMTPLYVFLSSLDIFAIWYLAVSVIGISVVHKVSKGKAAIFVLVPFAIMIIFSVSSLLFK